MGEEKTSDVDHQEEKSDGGGGGSSSSHRSSISEEVSQSSFYEKVQPELTIGSQKENEVEPQAEKVNDCFIPKKKNLDYAISRSKMPLLKRRIWIFRAAILVKIIIDL